MRKLLICTALGTFSAFHYMVYIFLSDYNSRNIQDIKLKYSAFLSLVDATQYVKFQSARCTDLKVGIFRIVPIPELSCAKREFSLCPPIPELYRTILELRKGYMLKIDKICVPAQSGNSCTN